MPMSGERASRVLVVMGGPDAERAVSLDSGAAVAAALRAAGWRNVESMVLGAGDRPSVAEAEAALRDRLAAGGVDVAFPALHGPWGEGGGAQAVLEDAGVPFVGAGSIAAALAMDKPRTKSVLAQALPELRTPPWSMLAPGDSADPDPPVVLKAPGEGSSIGVALCRTPVEVAAARRRLHAEHGALLAERLVEGREITAAIVGSTCIGLLEVVPAEGFYDYEAKYHRADTAYRVDPNLPAEIEARCCAIAERSASILGARHVARVDFMVDDADAWLLEVNTMPGFTSHSILPKIAAARGRSLGELASDLLVMALGDAAAGVADPAASGGGAR